MSLSTICIFICSDIWFSTMRLAMCCLLSGRYHKEYCVDLMNAASVFCGHQYFFMTLLLIAVLCIPQTTTLEEIATALENSCGESEFSRSLDNLNHYYMVHGSRLVGARGCVPNAWPWTAQLAWRNGAHRCGAALVDANYIVTAAHCFAKSRNPRYYRVFLGGHETGTGDLHAVRNISIHPLFNIIQPSSYDVAVARIEPPANFSVQVRKVCLPIFPVPDNKICVVTGWGHDSEGGNRSRTLKEIHVPILSPFICNDPAHYKGQLHLPSMICAGYSQGGIDACQGDSGGPLFCEVGMKWELHGLVSWGHGCARPNNPGVYTKIAAVVPWIQLQMLILH